MSPALPPETFRSYVQVNLYGASLRSIQQRGIDIPQLLACVGFSHCIMTEIPLFSEEIQRHLERLNPTNHTGNVTGCPLETSREIKNEEFLEDGERLQTVRHSTPFQHTAHHLLDCSLSTIHSDMSPAVGPDEPSSLSVTPSGLPGEPSSLSVTTGETPVGQSQQTVVESSARGESSAILAWMDDVLNQVQADAGIYAAPPPVIAANSGGVEDFFDCETDMGLNFLGYHSDDQPTDLFPGPASPIDLPPLKKCHSTSTPRSPPPLTPGRGASLPNIRLSPPPSQQPVKEECDSLDATIDANDFMFEKFLEDVGSMTPIKEESSEVVAQGGDFNVETDRSFSNTNPEKEEKTNKKTPPARVESDEEGEEFYLSDMDYEDAEDAPVKKRARRDPAYDVMRKVKCHFQSCGKEFKWRRRYGTTRFMDHVRTHYDAKTWKCRLCEFKAKTAIYVQRHHKSAHPGVIYEKAVNCASKADHNELLEIWRSCFPGCRQTVHATKENAKDSEK